jgi:hypothetical protein
MKSDEESGDFQQLFPDRDPRLEFCFLARDASVSEESGVFDAVEAGIGGAFVDSFPLVFTIKVVGRIHWRTSEVDEEHRITATVRNKNPGGLRVNRATNQGLLVRTRLSPDPWHHPFGASPTVFVLPVAPVILGRNDYFVEVKIDGRYAASIPLRFMSGEADDYHRDIISRVIDEGRLC